MYSQEITRSRRTAFVIAIDRSCSMQEKVLFGRREMSKAEAVACITDSLLTEIVDRCRRTDGIRDYYDVAVVGYSGDGIETLLGDEGFVSVERLARMEPAMTEYRTEETLPDGSAMQAVHTRRCWIEPKASGTTPMHEALFAVRDLAARWCAAPANRQSFPPVIINVTDGEASDCTDEDILNACAQIRRIATEDGNVLLLNVHISTDGTSPATVFPSPDEMERANPYARLLFECSSVMPAAFEEAIREFRGAGARPPFRGMAYNASVIDLLSIMNIGSRSVTNIE